MSKKRPSYIPKEQWIENLNSYVLQVAYRYLPLRDFGFYETYRDEYHTVILDSEWCRVQFFGNWESDYPGQPIQYYVLKFYGRLHAPNESMAIEWKGEKCKCWINIYANYSLEFINYIFPSKSRPSKEEILHKLDESKFSDQIHWTFAVEAEVWKHYAPELFYLFDLRRPELWEQYRAWLKEKYIAEGRNEKEDERQGLIPYYRVC